MLTLLSQQAGGSPDPLAESCQWTSFTKTGVLQEDEEILKNLMVEAPNQRERRRLERLQCEHAGAWVCAVPSTHDGVDTVMRPRNFRVAAGLPVLDEEKRCSLCTQIIDVFGDHGACCSVSSDRIHRHNRVRNLLDRICQEGMLSPVMEKYRLLGDVYGRRPGDVTIPVWRATKVLPLTWQSRAPLAPITYLAQILARVTRRRRSTLATTTISKALRLSLQQWS